MKVVFFGLGSIGTRHAGILLDSYKHDVFAFRNNKNCDANELGIEELFSWEEVKGLEPEIAFITNPTFLHIKTAIQCASLGMHLFIEKPLSNTLDGIPALEEICRERKLTSYVAYNMRFHPVIKKMNELLQGKKVYHARAVCSSYLPHWRPGADYLKSYSALQAQGGGVLLDLSHEFDYIKYLLGPLEKIQGKYGRIADITVDAEDYADIVMTLESGAVANIHLNFMSLLQERKIVVDYKGGYCIGDFIKGSVSWKNCEREESLTFDQDRNTTYREQVQYFFDNIGNPHIMNNVKEASRLLEKILEFKNG